jgi:DNA-binding NtrC family response regulator
MGVETREAMQEVGGEGIFEGTSLKSLVADYERRLILEALDASGWHQRRAAARLGLLPTTLFEKMKRLGLRRARVAEPVMFGADAPR